MITAISSGETKETLPALESQFCHLGAVWEKYCLLKLHLSRLLKGCDDRIPLCQSGFSCKYKIYANSVEQK